MSIFHHQKGVCILKTLRLAYKFLKYTVFSCIGLVLLYFLIAVVFSLIPVNRKHSTETTNYPVYLATNGVHMDIVLPYSDSLANWNKFLKFDDQISPFVQFIGIGWGDKDFYINTPTWGDLTFSTAFAAAFLKGQSAMHVSPYLSVSENERVVKVYLTKEQYITLTRYIRESFKKNPDNEFAEIKGVSYAHNDKFYLAHKSYHLFYTCNSWVNQGLKKTGIRTSLWTPFDKAILFQIKQSK